MTYTFKYKILSLKEIALYKRTSKGITYNYNEIKDKM